MKKEDILIVVSIIVAALVVSVSISFADCSADSCYERVNTLYLRNDGDIYIGTTGNENSLSCTPESGVYIVLRNNHPLHKEIYAALLTAHFLDRIVRIRIFTGSSPCRLNYVVTDTRF